MGTWKERDREANETENGVELRGGNRGKEGERIMQGMRRKGRRRRGHRERERKLLHNTGKY